MLCFDFGVRLDPLVDPGGRPRARSLLKRLFLSVRVLPALLLLSGCQAVDTHGRDAVTDAGLTETGKSLAETQLESLAWLQGSWRAEAGTRIVFETWLADADGSLSGTGAMAAAPDGSPEVYEHLQLLAADDEIRYIVTGAGNEQPVTFVLKSADEQRFRFENLAHDFPKRIEYVWLDEDHFRVEVSDATGPGGRGFALDFFRVPPGAR